MCFSLVEAYDVDLQEAMEGGSKVVSSLLFPRSLFEGLTLSKTVHQVSVSRSGQALPLVNLKQQMAQNR